MMLKRRRLVSQNPPCIQRLKTDITNDDSEFKYQLECINQTTTDITVVFRDNLPVPHYRCSNPHATSKNFIIRKTYSFNSLSVINESLNNLAALWDTGKENNVNEDLAIIYKSLMDQRGLNKNPVIARVVIDRVLDVDSLLEEGHCYLSTLDLMIYHGKFNAEMLHPYSAKAKALELFNETIEHPEESLGIMVQLVDNENAVSARYMYVANKVVELPSVKDPERASGVYITDNNKGKCTTRYKPLTEIGEEFGIHATVEDAMTSGNPALLHKSRLLELEQNATVSKVEHQTELHEAKKNLLLLQQDSDRLRQVTEEQKYQQEQMTLRLKRDIEEQKHNYELQVLELKQEADHQKLIFEQEMLQLKRLSEKGKMKYEKHVRKAEKKRHKTKDIYEHRSYERKDKHESLKNLGIIASLGLGLFAVIKKV